MFVIGTAGHIDHGKSSLIIKLTGINPDRLPEEQKRAMTIDLGFAWYDTPDGQRIGIVDVPGHERFVKNMIAGAGGIDAVIMVVAADDGWMPQSQEHLQITKLLGVKTGIVALTKIDLVDSDWIELVADDIKSKLKGTFLEDAPLVKLSSINGEGFDQLKSEINNLAKHIVEKADINKPRLYIDRSFILPGMGGVATGTLKNGRLSVGDEIAVYPARKNGRIRSMQSHNKQYDETMPGQRTALALTGVDHEYLTRGGVVAPEKLIAVYPDQPVMALQLTVLPESPIKISDRRRLLMIIGTTEVDGEIRTMPPEGVSPGTENIIFFKPFDPVYAFIGDRYIARMPTPQVTVGGGMILDLLDRVPRRKDMQKYEYLKRRLDMNIGNLIQSELDKNVFIKADDFVLSEFSDHEISTYLANQMKLGIVEKADDRYYRPADMETNEKLILNTFDRITKENPHLNGVPIESLVTISGQPLDTIMPIIELMIQKQKIVKKGNRYDIPNREISIKGELKKQADLMEKLLFESGITSPTVKEMTGDDKNIKEALNYLVNVNKVVKVNQDIVYHAEVWSEIVAVIRQLLSANGKISVKELRDSLNCSRKYLIPILEFTDKSGLTRRDGDVRIKGDNFEKE